MDTVFQVDRRSPLTAEEFRDEYVNKSRAVLIREPRSAEVRH